MEGQVTTSDPNNGFGRSTSLSHCDGSSSGYHKLGALHFIDKAREQFAQTCKYCFGIRTGRFVVNGNGAPEVVYERFTYHGLENSSSEPAKPKDISTETGNVD